MYTVTVTVGPIADYLVKRQYCFLVKENKIHCLLQIINQSLTKRRVLIVHYDIMFQRKTCFVGNSRRNVLDISEKFPIFFQCFSFLYTDELNKFAP